MFGPPFSPSEARIVAHKPEAVSEMVRTRARGLDRDCPHGVVHGFQITSHKSEPVSSSRNLLSKDDWRASLGDKGTEDGPEVAIVGKAFALARGAERLARAASRPNRSSDGPSRQLEGERPSANAGEEVALGEAFKVAWSDICDASLVDFAGRDEARGD